MRHHRLLPFALLPLAACNPAGQRPVIAFTQGDVQTALSIASLPIPPPPPSNVIDPSGAQCWGALSPAVAALQNGQTIGGATVIEVARVAIIEVRAGGPCGALAAPVLSQLALLPGAGNLIAIAAASVR